MSWQTYIDTTLVGSNTVDKAAIFDATGRSVWATSPGFAPKPEEMATIVSIVSGDKKAVDEAHGNGFHVEGKRFVLVKAEGNSLYGRLEKEGMIIVKTKQTLLVAHQPKESTLQQAANAVEGLAVYLDGVGF